MKKGDKLKLKPYSEICYMLSDEHIYGGLYFESDGMIEFCDKQLTLTTAYTTDINEEDKPGSHKQAWKVEENRWYWHEHWFESPLKPFLSDKDFDI